MFRDLASYWQLFCWLWALTNVALAQSPAADWTGRFSVSTLVSSNHEKTMKMPWSVTRMMMSCFNFYFSHWKINKRLILNLLWVFKGKKEQKFGPVMPKRELLLVASWMIWRDRWPLVIVQLLNQTSFFFLLQMYSVVDGNIYVPWNLLNFNKDEIFAL